VRTGQADVVADACDMLAELDAEVRVSE
jgi:hypothetical protein